MQRKAHKAQSCKDKGWLSCQVDGRQERLSKCKAYCSRLRVCPTHLAAQWVSVKGVASRFCQLCAKFHVVEEFDGCRRSCRIKLARHNESKKQRRKAAAQRQQTDRTLATSHQFIPGHVTQKQHIACSTEYESVPASGSTDSVTASCSSQRPPSAESAASQDDESLSSLLSRIIRMSGCRVSMNCSSSPSKRQVHWLVTADQQQMASKAQGTCDWRQQQQQQRSSSSDMDCCDDLHHDHGQSLQIGLDEGIAAVANAELHTSPSSREPSPAFHRAVRPPAAAAAHSGESSPGASLFLDSAETAATVAAYAINTTTYAQPTHTAAATAVAGAHRPRLCTPFDAVGFGTHSTFSHETHPY